MGASFVGNARDRYIGLRLRQHLRGGQFRYGMNRRRFHYSGILDGRRAMEILRYVPSQAISWPVISH